MDQRPTAQYATAPDGISLAYQVFGEGSVNVLWLPGFSYPVDLLWEEASFARFAKRLSHFSRTLWFGGRGMGASGSGSDFFDIFREEVTHRDITTVLDAFGWDHVAVVGTGIATWIALSYAALHPERVSALITIDGHAHYVREEDYPIGVASSVLDAIIVDFQRQWGSGTWIELLAPSRAGDPAFRETVARWERLGQPPHTTAEAIKRACMVDVRHYLPAISAPTLVLHRAGDLIHLPDAGRYLAAHIPGAKYVELSGNDHFFFLGDADALLDEVEQFLTGWHEAPEGDVATATILFTDIVSSTEQAATMGHRKWTALVDAHDTMIRTALRHHRGREIKTVGDGFLATFDATTRAVRAAREIVTAASNMAIQVRAGVHIGEVEIRDDDVVGLPVSVAKRICDYARPGEVFVSSTVSDLVSGSGIEFEDRGEHELKGVPGSWKLFAVEG